MASRSNGVAWASFVAGLGSVLTIPLAVYLTRFSASYHLLDSGWSIPLGAGLGLLAIVLARRARRLDALSLGRAKGAGLVRAGRVLGIVGLCIASAALISFAVYGLLEYAGSHG